MAVEVLQTLRDLIAIRSANPLRPCPDEAVKRGVAAYIEVGQLERAGHLYSRVVEDWPRAAMAEGSASW